VGFVVDKVAGNGRDFSPSASVSPCQYYSTIAPYSASSTYCSYQKDKRAKPGNFPNSRSLSDIGEHWTENHLSFFGLYKITLQ
jgi:hypothetical protein